MTKTIIKRVVCIYCNIEYKNALATRLRLHITKCPKCPGDVKVKFNTNGKPPNITQPVPSPSRREEDLPIVESPLPGTSSSSDTNLTLLSSDNTNCSDSSLERIDAALARAVYASGVPLSIFESHYWKEAFHLLKL